MGPIGVLCIRRTLDRGLLTGLVSGLGAATADAFYGTIAAFGLTLITDLLLFSADWLRLLGGLFLAYLGLRTLFAASVSDAATVPEHGSGLAAAYGSTLILTLTNPVTILAFVGIFAGLGGESAGHGSAALVMVAGVFAGSALWWLLLSGGVSLLRARFSVTMLRWVNRLSGAIILLFALAILWQGVSGG